jgi:hypothetical protein
MVARLLMPILAFAIADKICPKFSAIEQFRSERTIYDARLARWRIANSDRIAAMTNGARRAARRRMGTPAWVRPDDGFSVRKCIISDISPTGVRLLVDASLVTMKRFSLLMSRDAGHGCPCQVKWRRGTVVGAAFLAR